MLTDKSAQNAQDVVDVNDAVAVARGQINQDEGCKENRRCSCETRVILRMSEGDDSLRPLGYGLYRSMDNPQHRLRV